jgi:hypothetical protein
VSALCFSFRFFSLPSCFLFGFLSVCFTLCCECWFYQFARLGLDGDRKRFAAMVYQGASQNSEKTVR